MRLVSAALISAIPFLFAAGSPSPESLNLVNSRSQGQTLVASSANIYGTHFMAPEESRNLSIEGAIIREYGEAARGSSYLYNYLDLDGSGMTNVIVHLIGRPFCGSGGCTVAIFQLQGSSLNLVAEADSSHAPVIVVEPDGYGMRDLVTYQGAGPDRNGRPNVRLLRFQSSGSINNFRGFYSEVGTVRNNTRIPGIQLFGLGYREYFIEPLEIR